jgi:hypothetical protein
MRTYICLSAVFLAACSPAFTDGEYAISGAPGYSFSDTGGDGKFILRHADGKLGEIVVSARVVSYRVESGHLLVARRPMLVSKNSDGTLAWKEEGQCQFLSIDTAKHSIELLKQPIQGLSCR